MLLKQIVVMDAVFINFFSSISSHTEPEIDNQQALRNYIDRLKSIKDNEDKILSEQTIFKLEELNNRLSTSDNTARTATSKFAFISLFAL